MAGKLVEPQEEVVVPVEETVEAVAPVTEEVVEEAVEAVAPIALNVAPEEVAPVGHTTRAFRA